MKMVNGIVKVLNSKRVYPFVMSKSVNDLNNLMGGNLPDNKSIYKFISVSGGFSSVSFIKYVADREPILELTASTLRVGEKQFNYISSLQKSKKLFSARFFVGSIMKDGASKNKYDYFKRFEQICDQNGWKRIVINNHSKILLMRTERNFYVLETSSNLNENPKIEQYSFENSKDLYDFYYNFFDILEEV